MTLTNNDTRLGEHSMPYCNPSMTAVLAQGYFWKKYLIFAVKFFLTISVIAKSTLFFAD